LSLISGLARNLFHKTSVDQDLDQELTAYLELLKDQKIKAGMGARRANREALIELGGVELVKEQVRDVRIGRILENLAQDIRYGARTLARNPGFTIAAVLSLALGIGGNAAMFSLVNGVLIRPLLYPEPERLVRVTEYYPKGGIVALQQRSRTMDIAAYTPDSEYNLTGQGDPVHIMGSAATANLFEVLGARTEMGRVFQPAEDLPGLDQIVILSHSLWQDKFAADPAIIGRPVYIDGQPRKVVGVMPAGFAFPSTTVQLWIPVRLDPANEIEYWDAGWMPLVARLRQDASLAQARGELRSLVPQMVPMFPYPMPANFNSSSTVVPLQEDMVGDVRTRLLVLLGAVGLVLLIACANVAGLLLARATSRQKEIAIRNALGAGRGRIIRQLLTESVVLGLAGGGLGLLFGLQGLSVLKSVLPASTPRLAEAAIDWRVLVFVALLAILTGLVFGLAPAISASRLNLTESLKTRGLGSAGAAIRLRSFLISGEVALAVMLVIGAGLLIKSLWLLTQANPGFRPEQILTARVFPSDGSFQERAACISMYDEMIRQASRITGVTGVAAANAIPLGRELPALPVELEEHLVQATDQAAPMLWSGAVTQGYFDLMHIPILKGRAFAGGDSEKAPPVVIVSASTARRYWPNEDPIGKHIRVVWEQQLREVVGVAGDVRQYDLADRSPGWISGEFYMPYPQSVDIKRQFPVTLALIMRVSGDPSRVEGEIRRVVAGMNPSLPVSDVRTMETMVSASTSPSRSMMWLFACFAASALILAAIGTYGVVSYTTSQRMYELGLRVALGATRGGLFALVLRQSLVLVTIGLALGIAGAIGLTRLLASFLYGVTATDPVTFLAVGILLLGVALLAGYFPARRAGAADPLLTLRSD
jgi:predicted permease